MSCGVSKDEAVENHRFGTLADDGYRAHAKSFSRQSRRAWRAEHQVKRVTHESEQLMEFAL